MTRDDIIRMAREAGLIDYCDLEGDSVGLLALVTLCQDVAAAEREACAEIVEREASQYVEPVWAVEIVNDIRARGQE
jgi:cell division GTPase FtsZ